MEDEKLANKKEYMKQYYEKHRDELLAHQKQYNVLEIIRRRNSKRQRELGFIPLNKPFKGSVAHHIDKIYVIYIPEDIHHSIAHSVFKNKNMDEINAVAFNYLKI